MRYQAMCCAAAILALRLTSSGQAVVSTQVLAGECTAGSHIAEGPLGSDLANRQSRFYCDSAVITTLNDVPGHTIIDFSQKESRHANPLSFAGRFESPDGKAESTMQVNTVYLHPEEATTATEGKCKTVFEGQRLTGLICGVKVDEAGRRTLALVGFDAAPNQAIHLGERPRSRSAGQNGTSVAETNRDLFPDGSTFKTLPNGTKVATLPNGNKLEELADGTTWVVLHPDGELLGVRFDLNSMPTASDFRTEVIHNLPPSDIVNAPLSEKIRVEGDCTSKTYSILGVLPYAGKNGGGLPEADLVTGPENVVRRVLPGTLMSQVFGVVCKKL